MNGCIRVKLRLDNHLKRHLPQRVRERLSGSLRGMPPWIHQNNKRDGNVGRRFFHPALAPLHSWENFQGRIKSAGREPLNGITSYAVSHDGVRFITLKRAEENMTAR